MKRGQDMNFNWIPIMGKIEKKKDVIIFKGGVTESKTKAGKTDEIVEVGLFVCDQQFSEGVISVDVKFKGVSSNSIAEIILYYNPEKEVTLNAGIGNFDFFAIRLFDDKWTTYADGGAQGSIKPNRVYHLEASLHASYITLKVDGVEVLGTQIPTSLPRAQVGLFSLNETDIEFKNFKIKDVKPKVFVVMQFSSQYNDVYFEVIKKVCQQENINVLRIDEEDGPGLIIQDITRLIYESKIIIADVSPLNANVFYEVGFAHALNKPTILLAEKGTKLPFDVSPFRTLFYENSIGGKGKLEEGLKRHIAAILKQQG